MIGKLRGTIESLNDNHIILDVNGVGYLIHCVNSPAIRNATLRQNISLFIETIVREDSITLYGFLDLNDKKWFGNLIAVQGIGAKLAITILSVLNYSDLIKAILMQDKLKIKTIPGVGNKVAERLLTELKSKIDNSEINLPVSNYNRNLLSDYQSEALAALIKLGYGNIDATNAINISDNHENVRDTETLIKAALKYLAK